LPRPVLAVVDEILVGPHPPDNLEGFKEHLAQLRLIEAERLELSRAQTAAKTHIEAPSRWRCRASPPRRRRGGGFSEQVKVKPKRESAGVRFLHISGPQPAPSNSVSVGLKSGRYSMRRRKDSPCLDGPPRSAALCRSE
jgi:hypothetical protein